MNRRYYNSPSLYFRGAYTGLGDMSATERVELLQKGGIDKVIAALPGTTITDKLANGYAEAKTRLLKYTSTIRFDPAVSSQVLADIRAWQERNANVLAEYMKKPETDTLPEQIAYKLGPRRRSNSSSLASPRPRAAWVRGCRASLLRVTPSIRA